jgi:hypothetical protein
MTKPNQNCTALSIGGRSYRYCTDLLNWAAARDSCQGADMDLAIIGDSTENAKLVQNAPSGFLSAGVWLGGDDRGTSTNCVKGGDEGTWFWVDTANGQEHGTEFCAMASTSATSCTAYMFAYNNWASGQPDNQGCVKTTCDLLGTCAEGEDCLTMAASGAWSDSACDGGRGYICEQK